MTYKDKCTLQELSAFLMLTDRRVQQLKDANVIVKFGRGEYDLTKSTQGYINFLRERAFGGVANTDQHGEKTRLITAQANIAEMNDAELRGDLLRADETKRAIFTAARGVRNSLQTVADRLSQPLAGEDDHHEIHSMIEGEINQILFDMESEFAKLVSEPVEIEIKNETETDTNG
jgi:phage terminase Nu1 subunit (DNA packaging protein)